MHESAVMYGSFCHLYEVLVKFVNILTKSLCKSQFLWTNRRKMV